jgi:hypothetical protein
MRNQVLVSSFGILLLVVSLGVTPRTIFAAEPPQANVFFSPANQTVIEGSTFELSVYIDTKSQSVGTMELFIKYPQDLLEIVSPSAGQSLIQLWLQPPTYSNADGVAHFVGLIPNGVTTESGLITTITFRALTTGSATVSFSSDSQVLANDGLGTLVDTAFGRAQYTVTPKPPGGVKVFSDTHPFESNWYQDTNLAMGWELETDMDGFSYVLDTQPSTVPDNISEGVATSTVFSELSDGLHYFHIRASKQGVWGQTSHFLIRIDTLAPAEFQLDLESVPDTDQHRQLLNFFTSDSLSGVDHWEVGVIDMTESPKLSPVFVQAKSPYQFTTDPTHDYRAIVRAVDKAGNVRDESTDIPASVYTNFKDKFAAFMSKYLFILISSLLALCVAAFALHYLIGHHVYARIRMLLRLFKQTDANDLAKVEEQVARQIVPESNVEHKEQL